MNSLISCIIPAFKPMFIRETIDSIIAQTYEYKQIIIVDDGSPYNLENILRDYIENNLICYIRQGNMKMASARNRGILESQGDLIAFCDDDDLWEPTKLEKQSALFSDSEVAMAYTWADSIIDGCFVSRPRACQYPENNVFTKLLLDKIYFVNSSVMIRKDCIKSVGLFNESPSIYGVDDTDMWLRICHDYHIAVVPEILTHVRMHNNQVSTDMIGMANRTLTMKRAICQKFDLMSVYYRGCLASHLFHKGYYLRETDKFRAIKYYMQAFITLPDPIYIVAVIKLLLHKILY